MPEGITISEAVALASPQRCNKDSRSRRLPNKSDLEEIDNNLVAKRHKGDAEGIDETSLLSPPRRQLTKEMSLAL